MSCGSKWRPAPARITSRACSCLNAGLYTRFCRNASYPSAKARMRASTGIFSFGITAAVPFFVMKVNNIFRDRTQRQALNDCISLCGVQFHFAEFLGVSVPCLRKIRSGMAIFPTSCREAKCPISAIILRDSFGSRAIIPQYSPTLMGLQPPLR